MKKKVVPKDKEMIAEVVDIVRNTEDDAAAIEFLRDTLEDDFPDLELGSMDLHEAIKVLGGNEKTKKKSVGRQAAENLNDSLGEFLSTQQKKTERKRKPKKRGKKRSKKRRR